MEMAESTDEWVERNGKQVCRRCMHEKNRGYLKVSGSLCFFG